VPPSSAVADCLTFFLSALRFIVAVILNGLRSTVVLRLFFQEGPVPVSLQAPASAVIFAIEETHPLETGLWPATARNPQWKLKHCTPD
jgi:hypothetical protein